ncbi:MAG: hemerythrin domain-containing protein [Alphaproteobacteria bacterium]|nr:hemerythrin domain-containing protein [Alphaproteobacteria bacterium]
MTFDRQVSRMLHEEHMQAAALMERLGGALARHGPSNPPGADDAAFASLRRDLGDALVGEIERHFRFEEDELFPALEARGEGDLGPLLTEEHASMLPARLRLRALLQAGQDGSFAPDAWVEFHRLAGELVESLLSHIEKEEVALIPLIEETLDAEADARFAEAYAMAR